MRVARNKVELCGLCSDAERDIGEHPCRSTAAIELRFVLNRAETKALNAAWWLREVWFEGVVYRASRVRCLVFGRHGVTCEGRADHRPRTYQVEFRGTTLDAGKLRAMQDREAVPARQGRAR